MMVNWEFMDNMTPQSATQLVDDLRAGSEVTSTRGPRIVHLARGRAGARRLPRRPRRRGPAAGPASLVGLASPARTLDRPRTTARPAARDQAVPADTAARRDEQDEGK
jgi:NADH-quinone oxidoreductase subunit E